MPIELGDLVGGERAALVEDRDGREIGVGDIEAIGDPAAVDHAAGLAHGGQEPQRRFRRIFLVPDGDRQDPAGLQGAHEARHGLARVVVLLVDRVAAGIR